MGLRSGTTRKASSRPWLFAEGLKAEGLTILAVSGWGSEMIEVRGCLTRREWFWSG